VTNPDSKQPKVGDVAPDFELKKADGSVIQLSHFKGRKNVVLYFYPKDFTPGCTKEACSFRDSYKLFKEMNTEVFGVSTARPTPTGGLPLSSAYPSLFSWTMLSRFPRHMEPGDCSIA